ncbi:ABC transporter permease [Actinocrispum wychmicini]|uniref:NitT/TauT family transport system permease protein n=1 Tax=Actinocrispum wychmicini TaxID=1213861 RepID=A0A4R2JQV4_9PSEU|nr:ABC transporter permease subunit [Actinocrispum wychmicini]TCO59586.1 NitT/TauT family transport system permease protein [Actinocrispum wychmicini]
MRILSRVLELTWPLIVLVVGWRVWVLANGYTELVAPLPERVLADLVQHPGAYLGALLTTMWTALAGLVLGTALGFVLAVLVWASRILTAVLTPTAVLMRSVPVVAIVPVLIGVLGTGKPTVVAITAIVTFFPAFSLVGSGLRSASPASRDLFTVLGASKWRSLIRLFVPSAAPNLLVAVRIAAPSTILSAMLAEFLIGKSGLGFLFVDSVSYAQYARAWGTGVVATVLAVLAFVAATGLERWGLRRVR